MAEKRMLSKVISISEKVNELPDVFDMLLFTWMIPHTDDFGRMVGSPAKVKALVVPLQSKDISEIKASLSRLHDAELIAWYEVDGEKFIQILNFDKHQQGLHKRTKSKFPEYIPDDSGKFPGIPSELNRTEQKRTEENRTELEQIFDSRSPEFLQDNPFKLFESEGFGMLSSFLSERIKDMEDVYGSRWVCEAMKKAVVKGKRNLGYVEGILKNWKANGIDEPWKEEQHAEGNQSAGSGRAKTTSGSSESEFAFLDKPGRS